MATSNSSTRDRAPSGRLRVIQNLRVWGIPAVCGLETLSSVAVITPTPFGVVSRVRRQDRLRRPAGGGDAQLGADDVGGRLGHRAQGRGLAAGDRDQAFHALGLLVIEALERPGQLTPGACRAAADQRTYGRPGRAALGRGNGRD